MVEVIDSAQGSAIATITIPGGANTAPVEGGGMLVQQNVYDYSYYYGGGVPKPVRLTYIDREGKQTPIEITLSSVGAYYVNQGAVRQGDKLYVSAGWDGVITLDLNQ